jgi:ATP-dependent Lon protease
MPETIENTGTENAAGQSPLAEQNAAVPFEISVLPLINTTLFPETVVPLAVGRPRSVAAVEAALGTEEKLLACISARTENVTGTDASPSDLYEVGTLVMIKRMMRSEAGDAMHLIVQGTERVRFWVETGTAVSSRAGGNSAAS